jgi:hypothetical protein
MMRYMNRGRARVLRRFRSLSNWLNSHDAGLDHVGTRGGRSLAIQPIRSTILNNKRQKSVGSSNLTVCEAAAIRVRGELNIGDDKNRGLGDCSNMLRGRGRHGILWKTGRGLSRGRQIDRVNFRVVCGCHSAVERQCGSWSALFALRAAREGDKDGRGLVHRDSRSKKDGGKVTERCCRATLRD